MTERETLEAESAFWRKAADEAKSKEAALIAFGAYAGIELALEKIGEKS